MHDNPFSPPTAEGTAPIGDYHVEGELLVIAKDGPALPDRCVKCNAPATERFQKQLQWIPRWVPFTILLCWPVYFAAFFMMRQTGKVDLGLCDAHYQRYRNFTWAGSALLIAGLVLLVGGIFVEALVAVGIGFVALIGGIFVMMPGRVVWPSYMEGEHGYYKGAAPEFLDSL